MIPDQKGLHTGFWEDMGSVLKEGSKVNRTQRSSVCC